MKLNIGQAIHSVASKSVGAAQSAGSAAIHAPVDLGKAVLHHKARTAAIVVPAVVTGIFGLSGWENEAVLLAPHADIGAELGRAANYALVGLATSGGGVGAIAGGKALLVRGKRWLAGPSVFKFENMDGILQSYATQQGGPWMAPGAKLGLTGVLHYTSKLTKTGQPVDHKMASLDFQKGGFVLPVRSGRTILYKKIEAYPFIQATKGADAVFGQPIVIDYPRFFERKTVGL